MLKKFSQFYYNGIFLKMTGKLKHLYLEKEKEEKENKEDKEDKDNNSENYDDVDVLQNIKNRKKIVRFKSVIIGEPKKEENNIYTLRKSRIIRLEKSRGLRKILSKRALEKKELLRLYFFKFYRAGIVSQFKKIKRRKTCQFRIPNSLNIESKESKEINEKSNIETKETIFLKNLKEKEELKKRMVKSLEKIIFKEDRRNKIILKNALQKYFLMTKLESVKNVLEKDKRHIGKRNKGKEKTDKRKRRKNYLFN